MRILDSDGLKAKGIGYCVDHIRRLVKAGKFPVPFRIADGRKLVWDEQEIDDYLARCKRGQEAVDAS